MDPLNRTPAANWRLVAGDREPIAQTILITGKECWPQLVSLEDCTPGAQGKHENEGELLPVFVHRVLWECPPKACRSFF